MVTSSSELSQKAITARRMPRRLYARSLVESDISTVVGSPIDVGTWHVRRAGYADVISWRVLADLKPENLCFRFPGGITDIVIIDFGFSQIVDVENFKGLTDLGGTLGVSAFDILL